MMNIQEVLLMDIDFGRTMGVEEFIGWHPILFLVNSIVSHNLIAIKLVAFIATLFINVPMCNFVKLNRDALTELNVCGWQIYF
jgi:hypothetical protein